MSSPLPSSESSDSDIESVQSMNQQCSVYTPALDVSVVARLTPEGEPAGLHEYSFSNPPVSDVWDPEDFTRAGSDESMDSVYNGDSCLEDDLGNEVDWHHTYNEQSWSPEETRDELAEVQDVSDGDAVTVEDGHGSDGNGSEEDEGESDKEDAQPEGVYWQDKKSNGRVICVRVKKCESCGTVVHLGPGKTLHALWSHQEGEKCEKAKKARTRNNSSHPSAPKPTTLADFWTQGPRTSGGASSVANRRVQEHRDIVLSNGAVPRNLVDPDHSRDHDLCPGIELEWPGSKMRTYPFHLHDFEVMTYKLERFGDYGEIFIRSRKCHRHPRVRGKPCMECRSLNTSSEVLRLRTRANQEELELKTNLRYLSFNQLADTIERKNQQKDAYRLEVRELVIISDEFATDLKLQLLHLGQKYISATARITDHERFIDVAARNDRDGLGRLIKVAIKNKRGIREITRRSELAIKSIYNVKSFTVRQLSEDLNTVLTWISM